MKNDDFLLQINKQLAGYRKLLVGFSGGLDSSVLLHLLTRLRTGQRPDLIIRAIHIHHGINPQANDWVEHCQYQCQQWQVPLEIVPVQLNTRKNGIEAAARAARYHAFSTHLTDKEVLLTAQHQDDQCETFLLALKRGSGPTGLSAMASKMAFAQSQLLRPLLSCSRQNLMDYAQRHQIQWVEDESNQDRRFDRNFLRQEIIPLLNQRWPHFSQTVTRSASLCAEQEQLLDELLTATLDQWQHTDGSLTTDGLITMSEVKRNAVLRRWLSRHHVSMPSRDQLQRLWHEVVLARIDANPCLQLGQHQVRRFRQRLYLSSSQQINITSQCLHWCVSEDLLLPANLGVLRLTNADGQQIRAARPNESVKIRFGLQGKVKIVGRDRSRESKKLWQELGVPPLMRNQIPLLYFNEQLIAACDFFVTAEGQAKQGERCWHVHWNKPLSKPTA
ncbi:tRNA lysidine(34) synthetase TilS [Candidatus Regiella insecticola]|uniref:tRNA lysidine(34) synthetase TilS n=1 Tax=Candidatus Regiella insecticola TaxID=138073 RepID=UPI0006808F6C|nr:tRNA lysidine(34) synthetase TilS [Candidatus Regiella insecticola]